MEGAFHFGPLGPWPRFPQDLAVASIAPAAPREPDGTSLARLMVASDMALELPMEKVATCGDTTPTPAPAEPEPEPTDPALFRRRRPAFLRPGAASRRARRRGR